MLKRISTGVDQDILIKFINKCRENLANRREVIQRLMELYAQFGTELLKIKDL
jgi:hypothetical protein